MKRTFVDMHPKYSALLSALFIVVVYIIDRITPPGAQVFVYFTIPILLVSWNNSLRWGMVLAFGLPILRFGEALVFENRFSQAVYAFNAVNRMLVFGVLVWIVAELRKQLATTKLMQGLLPICASCKKMKNEKQEWQVLEEYVMEHTEATLTHGVCPDCMKRDFPDAWEKLYGGKQ